jgi:para-aminobenzoate synthetase component 1
MIKISLLWKNPLDIAQAFLDQKYLALLYSGYINNFTGEKSFLCICPENIIQSDNFHEFENIIVGAKYPAILDRWFGYLSYDLKNELEKLPIDAPTYITAPKLFMVKYNVIFEFDHKSQMITLYARDLKYLDYAISRYPHHEQIPESENNVKVTHLNSNMTDKEYFSAFDFIMESIKAGDIYQANLTRKFFGEIEFQNNNFRLFRALSNLSPSPYSAYLKFDRLEVVSSSPEQFLTIDSEGFCSSRPIKGTARRSDIPAEDIKIVENLKNCPKNRAENLMITDLMRNDFARSSVIGSVDVKNLFEVATYKTLHHMSSAITSYKRPDISSLEFVKRAFPPGSMTGCPKIKAMEICSKVEKLKRGIYSGALGYFGEDGVVDLSVIIRTIIIQDSKFEFQVGGAITYDSKPDLELDEIYVKATAIMRAMGIKSLADF